MRNTTRPAPGAEHPQRHQGQDGAHGGLRSGRDRGAPRDRGTFEPQLVKKRQRRLEGVDQVVLSLYARGLTTGEISAHFAEIYGASVSKETISRITDRVLEEMHDCAARPLDEGQSLANVANEQLAELVS